jgi:hypothetical protein
LLDHRCIIGEAKRAVEQDLPRALYRVRRLNVEESDAQARRVEQCRAFCGANDLPVIEEYGDPTRARTWCAASGC